MLYVRQEMEHYRHFAIKDISAATRSLFSFYDKTFHQTYYFALLGTSWWYHGGITDINDLFRKGLKRKLDQSIITSNRIVG